ncbi:hypothetical protein IL306_005554 [Fusarium sp. DS 682]|nr:hypothetical protein IL306_005554 [Fusarium sp. DS 682]
MRRIGNCKGILPENLRDEVLRSHGIKHDDLDDWDSAFKDSDAFDGLPGRIPSAEEIELVYAYFSRDVLESLRQEYHQNRAKVAEERRKAAEENGARGMCRKSSQDYWLNQHQLRQKSQMSSKL